MSGEKQNDLFGNLTSSINAPKNHDEWIQLEISAQDTFSPHAPIDDDALFAGRADIVSKLVETIFQKGQHAIMFGERGVGKTSLANILKDRIFSKARFVRVTKRNCTKFHDFRTMWVHALDDYEIEGKDSEAFLKKDLNPYDIYKFLEGLKKTEKQVIIFDEFDRIEEKSEVCHKLADTIKYLADYPTNATIIVIGVADSVGELFGGHQSIHRNVQQVRMPRMNATELRSIFEKRLPVLGVNMPDKLQDVIVDLSQGLPGYTHLIGQGTCVAAIQRYSLDITPRDLKTAIKRCIDGADETVRDAYLKAVRSTKPRHQYREALLACARAETNEKGFFNAASIREPFSKILGRAVDIPNYARHIKEFCDPLRGPPLIREGKPKSYEYRFSDPLLRPYVILRGIAEEEGDL
jgi:Cdc6-like AAA superfamily ATPase